MDRLEAMSLVLAVAETGSLNGAARRLNTPAATASRKISELEAHLRAKLFDRSGKRLALTEAGSTYVAASKHILAEVEEAERAASGEYTAATGELVVTATVTLGRLHLVPVVADFLRAYPDIDIRLILEDQVLGLREHHVDLALRIGELPDSRLIASRLGTIRRVMCASPGYLAAHGTPRTPADLGGHDCISVGGFFGEFATNTWTFVHDKTDIVVPVQPRLVVSNAEAACEAARAGAGIARVFSYHVASLVELGALTTVLDDYQPAPLPVSIVYAAGRFLPIKLRAFLDFATPRLKTRLAK
ncbi:MAG: LysR family transcriptional regulator [Alphaproteobacteria bacterium]|nr:LysR family transcriptional regulator [Alphaproteobacteria bacterium]